MIFKMLVLLMVAVAATLATPLGPYAPQPAVKPLMPYAFEYGVNDYSGVNFGRQEHSDGNAVRGSYSVALPDGRLQTVNYKADPHHGFVADVQYSGHAHHPPTATHGSGAYGHQKY